MDTAVPNWIQFWSNLGLDKPIKKGSQIREASYNWGSNQIDAIYVLLLLKEFDFELWDIDDGICGTDHRAMILEIFQHPWCRNSDFPSPGFFATKNQ